MGLRELTIKSSYDSEEDDVINDFYIPALSQSVLYRRLAGFFSSSCLAIAARGIASLISNNGKIELVVGARLSKQDVDAIKKGVEKPEDVIENMMIRDIDDIQDEFSRNHVKALAWLIAQKRLEIKVAIIIDDNGNPLDQDEVDRMGIFHQKVGIFQDKNGDVLSFSGSINESAMGWNKHIEEIKIFISWEEVEKDYLESDWRKFQKYWYGVAKRVKIMDIPSAIREKLIQIAPKNIDELILSEVKRKEKIKLRPIQSEAVNNWLANDKKGIFEMATASGKTYTALGCVRELEKNDNLAVVIVCPFKHLIQNPWIKSIDNFGFSDIKKIKAFGSTKSWIQTLSNEILNLNSRLTKRLFILTTYDSFSNDSFIENIKKIKSPVFLIADEVHNAGSAERKAGLIDKYDYRLGLSATPSRWFDDEGTKIINEFFDKTVYKFSISDAIKTTNPDTGETYLTPYEYNIHLVEMTAEEFYEYEKLTKEINRKYYQTRNNQEKMKFYELLLFQRSRIIKNAKNKITEFEKIIDSIDLISHCLVYCSPSEKDDELNQMHLVKQILDKRNIVNHQFTQIENDNEREMLLKKFDEGKYHVLIAIKCLDEGVDIPSTKTAIILANTTNPRESIQRRGRVIRRFPGKEKAVLHDFLVVPTLSGEISPENLALEQKILRNELERVTEFAESSINKLETLNKLIPVLKKYNLSLPGDLNERERSQQINYQ